MAKNPPGYGQEPKASPAARSTVIIVGLLLFVIAGICIRDLVVRFSGSESSQWIAQALAVFSTKPTETWMLVLSGAFLVLAVFLLFIVFKPRARRHRKVVADSSVWIRPVDIARMASASAQTVSGVAYATSELNGNKIRLTATGNARDETLPERIKERVTASLTGLDKQPRLSVKVQQQDMREELS